MTDTWSNYADGTELEGSGRAAPHGGVGRDVIVVGASAGGVEALSSLVARLPADLPAAIFVVLHLSPTGPSVLPAILARAGRMPAEVVEDGDPIEHGRIYVAPPGFHLLVAPGHLRLGRGPREHANRPAIDPLFRTAAASYGPRAVGVLLSGTLDDGTAGLAVLKRRGGVVLVQRPDEALFSGMPSSAIEHIRVDRVLPLAELASELIGLVHTPVPARADPFVASPTEELTGVTTREDAPKGLTTQPALSCPDCGGPLAATQEEAGLMRFSCQLGHVFSEESLVPRQSDTLETALWAALRGLEERATLLTNLALRLRARGSDEAARRYEEQARDSNLRARYVRKAVLDAAIEDLDTAAAAVREGSYPESD